MPHIILDASTRPPRLEVDGIDIAPFILEEGFAIVPTSGGRFEVSVKMAAVVKADLPDAVLKVLHDVAEGKRD